MDSFFARNRLSAYVDGVLSPEEAAQVAEAIERDPDLQEEYRSIQFAVDLLQREGPVSAPPGFHARVLDRLRDEPSPGGPVVRLRQLFGRVPLEGVALAAAALFVFILIQDRPQPDATSGAPQVVANGAPVAATQPGAAQPAALQSGAKQEMATPQPSGPPPSDLAANATAEPSPPEGKPDQAKSRGNKTPTAESSNDTEGSDKAIYVPEWEMQDQAGGEITDPTQLTGTRAYRATVTDTQTLYQLSALAESHGGSLLDPTGRPLRAHALSAEQDFARVTIVVPQSQADAIHGAIRALGATAASGSSGGPLVSPDQVGFTMEITLQH